MGKRASGLRRVDELAVDRKPIELCRYLFKDGKGRVVRTWLEELVALDVERSEDA